MMFKIYENLDDNKTLMDGFCIQHPIFIQTNTLVSKIISCFNYFYSRYLNQDNEYDDDDDDNKSKYSMRNKYKRPKIKNDVFDSNIFVQNLLKIPYRLIDLLILFVDLHDKYDTAPLTNEVTDKIENFYNTLSYIYDIKNKYSKDIENSKKKIRVIKNVGQLKRTKTQWKKAAYLTLFPKKRLLFFYSFYKLEYLCEIKDYQIKLEILIIPYLFLIYFIISLLILQKN